MKQAMRDDARDAPAPAGTTARGTPKTLPSGRVSNDTRGGKTMAMRDTGHDVRQCGMSLAEVEQIAEDLVAKGLAERRVNANGEVEYRTLRRREADGIHRQEEKGR